MVGYFSNRPRMYFYVWTFYLHILVIFACMFVFFEIVVAYSSNFSLYFSVLLDFTLIYQQIQQACSCSLRFYLHILKVIGCVFLSLQILIAYTSGLIVEFSSWNLIQFFSLFHLIISFEFHLINFKRRSQFGSWSEVADSVTELSC